MNKKLTAMAKHRELWISKIDIESTGVFGGPAICYKIAPDTNKDSFTHVIEYAAVAEVSAREQELLEIIELHDHAFGVDHMGMFDEARARLAKLTAMDGEK